MGDTELRIRCQRCGTPMEMRDPVPGSAWKPDQFWACARCGRHFWSTYPDPSAKPAAPAPKPAAPAANPAAAAKPPAVPAPPVAPPA